MDEEQRKNRYREREGKNPESRRKQEIKWKKGEDVARPSRHQSFHLRSSKCRSVSNSRMLGNNVRAGLVQPSPQWARSSLARKK